jgi:hypothetical protein
MLHAGTSASRPRTRGDGWSVVTRERERAAHEHTVAVTDDGPEVLMSERR